jgi:hypothetical protein
MRRKFALVLGLLAVIAVTFNFINNNFCDPSLEGIPGFTQAKKAITKRPCEEFYPLLAGIFPQLDRDGKGYITQQDIDRAVLSDRSIKGDQAAAMYALRQTFDLLAVRGSDGVLHVGPVELQRFHATLPALPAQSVDEHMTHARSFLKKVNRGLYPSGSTAQSIEKMRAIHQTHRGNCYFESGCGSLAVIDPARVRSMITDNGVDNRGIRTYSVRFLRCPDEEYVVDELTDTAMLINDVDDDSGVWLAVLVRAYGMYNMEHPWVRIIQRVYFGLNKHILPEDITDQGSMFSDGLRMCSAKDTRVKQVLFEGGVDSDLVKRYTADGLVQALNVAMTQLSQVEQTALKEYIGGIAPKLLALLKKVDEKQLRGPVTNTLAQWTECLLKAFLYTRRDAAVVHAQLKHSICDEHLPATVFKYGGAHEASIIAYQPGTVSADGKHQSKYGFVTIHDQAGISDEENAKVKAGLWWREPGMDDQTIRMSVEEFTAFYTGYTSVVRPGWKAAR